MPRSMPRAGELFLVSHDLEEFNAVVRRHGPWREDVRAFAEQLTVVGGQDNRPRSKWRHPSDG